jgi:hypothetical protein
MKSDRLITVPVKFALSLSLLMTFANILANSTARADNREDFVQDTLPRKYPQLIDYVRTNGTLPVFWMSQSDEAQSLTVEWTIRESVMVTTTTFLDTESSMNTPTLVIMIDRDLDSRLDFVLMLPQGDEPQISEFPTDEALLFLWETAMAITMKFSNCCPT